MKSFRTIALASAALSGLGLMAPLQAADVYAPPPPVPVVNWTGFYIGAGGGGHYLFADSYTAVDFFAVKEEFAPADFFPDVESSADLGQAGAFGTVQGGFDWQFGDRFVAGIFGNYDFGGSTSASHSASSEPVCDPFCIRDEHLNEVRARVTLEDSWAIGGRLGFLSSESTLWYGLAGYTRAKITGEAGYTQGGIIILDSEHGGDFQYSWGGWQDGLVVGAGVETLLSDAISLKLEYRYTDYDSFGGYDGSPIDEADQVAKFDPEVHSIRGVVSWRFGNLF